MLVAVVQFEVKSPSAGRFLFLPFFFLLVRSLLSLKLLGNERSLTARDNAEETDCPDLCHHFMNRLYKEFPTQQYQNVTNGAVLRAFDLRSWRRAFGALYTYLRGEVGVRKNGRA